MLKFLVIDNSLLDSAVKENIQIGCIHVLLTASFYKQIIAKKCIFGITLCMICGMLSACVM